MRRALVVSTVVIVAALAAGCGKSDSAVPTKTSQVPTTGVPSTDPYYPGDTTSYPVDSTATPPQTPGKPIDAAGCARYLTLTQLFDDLQVIASGANSTQVAADTELAAIIDNIRDQPGAADDNITQAIDTIATFSFQAPGSPDGPTTQERNDALATIEGAFGETCMP